jgi:hypothetical protein
MTMTILADRSTAAKTKEELANYFKRKASRLQHKKYKMLVRFMHNTDVRELLLLK